MQKQLNLPIIELIETIPECQKCELAKTPMEPSYGTLTDISIMVVLENPSLEEHSCNWPFGDRANKYIKLIIANIFSLDIVYFTYMVKCHRGPINLGIKNSEPCIENYLDKEFESIKPKMILTMGKNCAKIIGKRYGTNASIGSMLSGNYSDNSEFILAFAESPTTILNKSKSKEIDFVNLLEKLKTLQKELK